MNDLRTTSKSIVITGASDGIGKALAWEMAKRGYRLGLTARRMPLLLQVKSEIQAKYPDTDIEVNALDVTDYGLVEGVLQSLHHALGGIDILLVNAGIAKSGLAVTMPLEDQLKIINTNLNGAIATAVAGLKIFRQQGGGQLVATSSVAGYRGLPKSAAYCASKAGLSTFMDAVRLESKKDNVVVSVINPGFIDTELNRSMANRPFVIPVEKGASLFADLIEKKVAVSTVPRMPWSLLAPMLRILPDSLISKM
jgi:short-subunit dehydrogenase